MQSAGENLSTKRHLILLIVSLAPFVLIPLMGSQMYFRHDDTSVLLWAKEYDQPFHHIFSPKPELNRISDYPGIAGAYRPFVFGYVKVLWGFFGTNAGPYHIIDGLIFMGAVLFLFMLARRQYGAYPAALGCLILFAAFHGMMYTLFHGGIPIGFLSQMVIVYFFWSYLERHRWYDLLGAILFLAPALSRQTTPIILAAIYIGAVLSRRGERGRLRAADIPVPAIIAAGLYIMTFTYAAARGSIVSLLPDYGAVLAFIAERFLYYGKILTSGLTGLIVLVLFSGGVWRNAATSLAGRFRTGRLRWLWPPAALLTAFAAMRLQPFGAIWLTFCIVILFVWDRELRFPLAWAGASLLSFLAVRYYHNAYLLEAAFPLSLSLGVLAVRLLGSPVSAVSKLTARRMKRTVCAVIAVAAAAAVLLVLAGSRMPLISNRIDLIRLSIDSNRNCRDLMKYIQTELPAHAVLYELDNERLGTTGDQIRFMPLKQRAARVKVLDITAARIMFEVMGRGDLQLRSVSEWVPREDRGEAYFIAMNNFEREIAEAELPLHLIREFKGSLDSAAMYRLAGDH